MLLLAANTRCNTFRLPTIQIDTQHMCMRAHQKVLPIQDGLQVSVEGAHAPTVALIDLIVAKAVLRFGIVVRIAWVSRSFSRGNKSLSNNRTFRDCRQRQRTTARPRGI